MGYANPTLTARYAYDALDRRIAKTIDDPGLPITAPAKPDPQVLRLNRQPGVDVPDLVLNGPFTVEGWVKFEAGEPIDNRDVTFASGPGQPVQNINFYLGWMRLYAPDVGGDKIVARTRASEQGVWTHYALTRDASGQLRIFVNGAEDVVGTQTFLEPFHIGFIAGLDGGSSEADFADFRVWSVARTESQIATFKSARLDETTPGLERLYRFEGSATDVLDATGNSAAASIPAGGAIVSSPDAPVASPPAVTPQPGTNAEVTAFVLDQDAPDPMSESNIVLEFSGPSPSLSRRWLHSLAIDEPLAFELYNLNIAPGSGQQHLLFADQIGTITKVTDVSGASIVSEYRYSGYGTRELVAGNNLQPFGLAGREFDEESGIYHQRMRAYDPETGLFLQIDPLGFGGSQENLYAYVDQDPYNRVDPMGLVSFFEQKATVQARKQTLGSATRNISGGAFAAVAEIITSLEGNWNLFDGGPKDGGSLGPGSGGSHHGNCGKDERGQHIYVIFELNLGKNVKVGIAGNQYLSADGRQSSRARRQYAALLPKYKQGLGHVVVMTTPGGLMSRAQALIMEQMMVTMLTGLGFPLDPGAQQSPKPDPDRCPLR